MTSRLLGVALAATALVATAPAPAAAQTDIETFVCESQNNGRNQCRFQSTGVVTVHVNRQISRTRCVYNENWGAFDGGVWVDDGCRAEFVVRRPPGYVVNPRPVGGTLNTVTCESLNNARQSCRVENIDVNSVTLERKLSRSECIRGYTWGVSDGENSPPGIWVTNGCRATFAYTTRGQSYDPWGGTPHDFTLQCNSLQGEWAHCTVPQIYLARIQLVASNSQCDGYKAWGTDDTGIWVRSNCRGEFRVRYRHEE